MTYGVRGRGVAMDWLFTTRTWSVSLSWRTTSRKARTKSNSLTLPKTSPMNHVAYGCVMNPSRNENQKRHCCSFCVVSEKESRERGIHG